MKREGMRERWRERVCEREHQRGSMKEREKKFECVCVWLHRRDWQKYEREKNEATSEPHSVTIGTPRIGASPAFGGIKGRLCIGCWCVCVCVCVCACVCVCVLWGSLHCGSKSINQRASLSVFITSFIAAQHKHTERESARERQRDRHTHTHTHTYTHTHTHSRTASASSSLTCSLSIAFGGGTVLPLVWRPGVPEIERMQNTFYTKRTHSTIREHILQQENTFHTHPRERVQTDTCAHRCTWVREV